MMHLFLSKEPCADYEEALKHTRRKNKREEDKRFKPPDLNLERHQDITCFILIKEAPPDAAYKLDLQDEIDLRTNPFQEGGDDMIMDQSNKEDNESMNDPADGGALAISEGPMTRARSKQLKEAIGGLLKTSLKQEESLGRSLINQDTLARIQAISSPR
ncbi:PREDICTED: uncharacterized protein LOC106311013 isoform X2 [Brassica oleracea var. oleracea]|uniref:uncharacterized protein LOC106311013 isoform X1 n=1 Tax=Brassica oleracea var. oleracea TaxID=109376 RepID=UPI0006A70851|nr:PREDICTED: uncharacterized protein LOC106311013 isoform X1 [Brassica oleracea var. oleracea]XP_013603697.1 PREDICTED: uncharacterized protein LOC106311013 isoform X2 [Brassica oleracea var. oleracea]